MLEHLLQPSSVGCGHLRLTMQRAAALVGEEVNRNIMIKPPPFEIKMPIIQQQVHHPHGWPIHDVP
jgi:hypothetical protein